MSTARAPDLACFGYLAAAQVMGVAAYPAADTGAAVSRVTASLAGDAPITALTARLLGLDVALVSNRVGDDPAGRAVLETLDNVRVAHQARPRAEETGTATPQLTIVTDDAGTRTWFAWLGTAAEQLPDSDLTPLTRARLAYVDCYRIIDAAAAAAITASRAPLLLNLGGDTPTDAIVAAAQERQITFAQTNLPEGNLQDAGHLDTGLDDTDTAIGRAEQYATDLYARIPADAVVVTLGRLGALARTATGTYRVAALEVAVGHTHGAGAVFSAGLAHAHLHGAGTADAIRAGCRVGSTHCASTCTIPQPRTPSVSATRAT
jgi:sugar/nucleoside kinase (ribokinase family)